MLLFAQDSGIRLFHLPGLVYMIFIWCSFQTTITLHQFGSYNEGGGAGAAPRGGGGAYDFWYSFIYLFYFLFIYFYFCLSAQRSVMSIMVIPHPIMIIFWFFFFLSFFLWRREKMCRSTLLTIFICIIWHVCRVLTSPFYYYSSHGTINSSQTTGKTPTSRIDNLWHCMRASRASEENFRISTLQTCYLNFSHWICWYIRYFFSIITFNL